jgi:photosystem II stability/assembly factor-like uncharacterized protein
MKRLTGILLVHSVLVLALLHPDPGQAQWAVSFTATPPAEGNTWLDLSFSSSQIGYLGVSTFYSPGTGFQYALLKTTDGGQSWQYSADNSSEPSVENNDLNNSRMAGNPLQSLPGSYIINMQAPAPDTLFFTTYGYQNTLRRLCGQGYTSWMIWYQLVRDLAALNGHLAFLLVSGVNPENISVIRFAGDSTETIYTNDTLTADNASKIFFVSPMVGFITVMDHLLSPVMLKTQDGGTTWTSVQVPGTGQLTALFFTSENTGYLASNAGKIYKTTNQGNSWGFLNTGTVADLTAIKFANDSVGAACGNNGTVIMTNDFGQTWYSENCSGSLSDIQLFNSSNVYVINSADFPSLYRGIYALSAGDLLSESITLSPNPVENKLWLKNVPSFTGEIDFEMSDDTGRIVMIGRTGDQIPIMCTNLPPGIYFLKLNTGHSVVVRKLIKM